jgi:DNA-binding CsgD family transcriptional regulator
MCNTNGLGDNDAQSHIAERAFLKLLHSDPALMTWCVREDGTISQASTRTAEMMFSAGPDDLIGRHLTDLLPSSLAHWLMQLVRRAAVEDGHLTCHFVWRGRRYRSSIVGKMVGTRCEGVAILTRPQPRVADADTAIEQALGAPVVELGPLGALTKRELEVLALLGVGYALAEIADRLERSVKTVKRFRDGIAQKLGVGDRTRLGMIARELGLQEGDAYLPRVSAERSPAASLRDLVPSLIEPDMLPRAL